jgi:glycosyltransferase involved in cell wall biosynthesis
MQQQDKNSKSLITIITVAFNAESTIETTIKSVLKFKKEYADIDYIIIDGLSTDNTLNIIQKYEHELFYWISEPDRGIYDAMNKGWNQARSSYILFLGSGDKILELPAKTNFSDNKNKVYYGKVDMGSKLFISRLDYKFKLGNTLHHQALLIHKLACKENPFDLQYEVYGDYNFSARLLSQGFEFIYLDDFKSYAMPGGISSTTHISEILSIVFKNFGFFWMITSYLSYIFQSIKRLKYKFYALHI